MCEIAPTKNAGRVGDISELSVKRNPRDKPSPQLAHGIVNERMAGALVNLSRPALGRGDKGENP